MPVCYITISSAISEHRDTIVSSLNIIRKIVAAGLDSKSRLLDENHISLRIQEAPRETMLADIELDIFAQKFLRRLFSRDKRANLISKDIEKTFNFSCATWINLGYVGYSRVKKGESFFSSKEDDKVIKNERKMNFDALKSDKE